MNKSILLIASLFVLSSFVPLPCNQDAKVLQAARDNFSAWLEKIPAGQEKSYGFVDRQEFTKSTVAEPYRMLNLKPSFYTDEKLNSVYYVHEQNEWRVPVVVNGENRLLLTVTGQSGVFQVTDLGGAGLAKELQQKSSDFKITGERYILRVYPLSADFIAVGQNGSFVQAEYIPLASAVLAIPSLGTNEQKTYSLAEVLQLIKQELKNHPKN